VEEKKEKAEKVFFSHTHFSFFSRAHKFIHQVNFFSSRNNFRLLLRREGSIETHFSSYIASQLSPTTIMFSQTCFNGNQKKGKGESKF
jgi:hypothetical protein